MKKLMTLMLGLGMLSGTVAISFAHSQDTKSDSTGKKKTKKSKKKSDTTKSGVRS